MLGEDINKLSFAFIAPLATQNAGDLSEGPDSSGAIGDRDDGVGRRAKDGGAPARKKRVTVEFDGSAREADSVGIEREG